MPNVLFMHFEWDSDKCLIRFKNELGKRFAIVVDAGLAHALK